MSLQEIPDSSGLLCVTLGHLEITEARYKIAKLPLCGPNLLFSSPITSIVF